MSKGRSKRVVAISDLHCGHKFGLTPPEWWTDAEASNDKHTNFQRALWEFYETEMRDLRPIDVLVVNGDAIDGKGDRNGGIEQLTTNRHTQLEMAAKCIDVADAKTVRVCYGTGYHTGKEEDFESQLPKHIKCQDAKVSGHLFLDINGCVFDFKHKIGKSTIPHGRVTPLIRTALWNAMWAIRDRQPQARVIVRSHVHYYEAWQDDTTLGVITPALQYNSNFGIRECEGVVNVGFVVFDVSPEGGVKHKCILADFEALKVSAESI